MLNPKGGLDLKDKRNWLDRLGESLDLPGENSPGQTIVEFAGDKRVLVERHGGVIAYDREQICIKVNFGILQIQGCQLELAHMTKDQLIIFGRIDSVTLCRRG